MNEPEPSFSDIELTPPGDHLPPLGTQLLGIDYSWPEEKINTHVRHMIARVLNIRGVIGFVGSGVSRAYGHPQWGEFARRLAAGTKGESLKEGVGLEREFQDGEKFESPFDVRIEDKLLLDLGDAKDAYTKTHTVADFNKKAADLFQQRVVGDLDPLKLIMNRLEIRRFLTTNYDQEIEHAFDRVLGCRSDFLDIKPETAESNRIGPIARSITVNPANYEDLVQFAIATRGYEYGVFHLHGSVSKSDSLIVTEEDYQNIYEKDDSAHRMYRDAVRLAMFGNPILFLGLGLKEADLLRPLRQFALQRRSDGRESPVFALIESKGASNADQKDFRRFLHARYGIKVWFYPSHKSDQPSDLQDKAVENKDRTIALCAAIDSLADEWHKWWEGWQNKPIFRRPAFSIDAKSTWNPPPMLHHAMNYSDKMKYAEGDKGEIIRNLCEGTHSVFVLLGRPGSGKGSLGQWLVEQGWSEVDSNEKRKEHAGPPARPRYENRFFATMHFTNDYLSTIDAAADFLGPHVVQGTSVERLKNILTHGSHLLVIGGIDRLLVPAPISPETIKQLGKESRPPRSVGKAMSREIADFFAMLNGLKTSRSHVILTSSVRPIDLTAEPIFLSGLSSKAVCGWEGFSKDSENARKLERVLDGHAYALSVVDQIINTFKASHAVDLDRWFQELLSRLKAVDQLRRAPLTIERVLRWLWQFEDSPRDGRLPLLEVLHAFAIFTTPVTGDVISKFLIQDGTIAAPEINPRPATWNKKSIDEAIKKLLKYNLLLELKDLNPDMGQRYTAHTVVRTHLLNVFGNLPDSGGEPQRFVLSGFSSEPVEEGQPAAPFCVQLTIGGMEALLQWIENPAARGEDAASSDKDGAREQEYPDGNKERGFLRAAFGLIRSRWSATGIGRHAHVFSEPTLDGNRPHYDAYQLRLIRLVNAIRNSSVAGCWKDGPRIGQPILKAVRDKLSDEKGILYADELAWLYNELGLVAYCQGSVPNAYSLFRIGQEINLIADGRPFGPRACQSELNLAMVYIERARLSRARYHLNNAIQFAANLKDRELEYQARGYMGLLNHLSGDYDKAQANYAAAIKILTRCDNRRAVSIFKRHLGDLYRLRRDYVNAEKALSESIAIAEAGVHPDLLCYARIAHSNLKVSQESPLALEGLAPALEFARKVGIPKLQADAYSVQSRIALAQGEIELAGRLSIQSLSLASSFGMRLRLTAGLVQMGRIAIKRGDREAAMKMLRSAVELGERQGYQLQIEAAERELMKMTSETM